MTYPDHLFYYRLPRSTSASPSAKFVPFPALLEREQIKRNSVRTNILPRQLPEDFTKMNSVHRQFGKLMNKGPGDTAQVAVLLNDYDDVDKMLTKVIPQSRWPLGILRGNRKQLR